MDKIKQSIYLSLRSFSARKSRTFLTMLGIIIGVSGVVIIVSIGKGAESLIVGQITKLGSNLVNVLPGKSDESGPPASVFGITIKTLKERDVESIKTSVPHIVTAAGIVNGQATVTYKGDSVDTNFIGVPENYTQIQNLPIVSGEFFSELEAVSGNGFAVLGYDVAKSLFPNNDNQNILGEVVKIKNIPFKIVGIADKQGSAFFQNQDDQIYIPLIVAQKQILGIDYYESIRAKVDTAENVKQAIEEINQVLLYNHNIKNPDEKDFSVRDLASAVSLLTGITTALRGFLALMAGISLIVGGIGIMNIMLVTVNERTNEIGLRKAIGAKPKDISLQFLIESCLLTIIGGGIGIVVGIFISYLISIGAKYAGYDWAFSIPMSAILIAFFVSMAIGVAFGFYPARKASKLDPIDALRYE